jgi:MFS family permease
LLTALSFFFASTWGPAAWVVIGEIFPLPIRAKGVALSTASNWFWNFIIGFITPYLLDEKYGNLKSKVFWIWGSTCTCCILFAYFLVPETRGLSLEQVDKMLEETTPSKSATWVPTQTFADNSALEGPNVMKIDAMVADAGGDMEHQEKV